MKRFIALLAGCVLSFGALAQNPAPADSGASCEAKAMGKNGKPLAGAAKKAFMKKCESEQAAAACEGKAMDKNGKPLAGAAKKSFMKKCEAGAK